MKSPLTKFILLRCINGISWIYAYIGMIYAVCFIYLIVIPSYNEQYGSTSLIFRIVFLFLSIQTYLNLIFTTFSSVKIFSEEKVDRYCIPCLSYAQERSHHCQLCQRCIPQHDHHCFFVSTCIGQHNQRYFLLFLGYILCAHIVGYIFAWEYLWAEMGGFSLWTILKILFFNVAYVLGYVSTKWQALICLNHYLVYIDFVIISCLFHQNLRRALHGQTEYEEKKKIIRWKTSTNKQGFLRLFGSTWLFFCSLICPLIRV